MMNSIVCKIVILIGTLTTGLLISAAASAAFFSVASGDTVGLVAAINEANSNGHYDTIKLAAGRYEFSQPNSLTGLPTALPEITSSMEINGSGTSSTIIERSSSSPFFFRIVTVNNTGVLTMRKLTITGGDTGFGVSPKGGGVSNQGKLNLVQVNVVNNVSLSGGGIENTGKLFIKKGYIANNTSRHNCGAILNDDNGNLTIRNSYIVNNIASGGGGAIWNGYHIDNTRIFISDSVFSGNTAGTVGGAINNHSYMKIRNTLFVGNTAIAGGAISNYAQRYNDIINSTFIANHATDSGGAIANVANTITGKLLVISKSYISRNTADRIGGGIDNNGGRVQTSNFTVISDNVPDNCSPASTC